MLGRHRQFRTKIFQVKDAALFGIALWLAHYMRANWPIDMWVSWIPLVGPFLGNLMRFDIGPFEQYRWLWVIIIPVAPLVLESQGFYQRPYLFSRRSTLWILFRSCVVVSFGIIFVLFLFKMQLARSVVILFGTVSFVLVLISEEIVRVAYQSRFGQKQLRRSFILVGAPEDTSRTMLELRSKRNEEIEIVAELDLNERTSEDLVKLLHDHSANGVILTARHTYFGQVEKAIQICELEGVEVWMMADFFQTQISHTAFDDLDGRPVLVFRTAPGLSWQGVAKQVLDIVGASILLVIFSPILVLAMIMVRRSSPGSILFRQQRCGLNGKPFTMLKFRSMVSDAEQRKQELEALNEMDGPVFKLTNDPRITPWGRVMRKYSIDEFPQLFNVLRGEMSLVGPRPLPVDEVRRFDDLAHRRRLSVKPGLTCLWQISGRNDVRDFKDWVRLDLEVHRQLVLLA